jgi:hypothetical protein
MEKKQTAVEWLFEKITQNQEIRWRGTRYLELFEQAKQMEKEQIRDAWTDGCIGELYELNAYFSSGKYYNKTYK